MTDIHVTSSFPTGAGRHLLEVKDLFVRQDHVFHRDDPAERRYQAPLYQFPQISLYASGFAATARRLLTASVRNGTPGPMHAYRRTGRPCPRCGTVIRSHVYGQDLARRVYWCPSCQA